jgi:ribosomal protein L6P/L9E
MIFIRTIKDILILSWLLKRRIKDNIRGYCLIFNLIGLGFTMTIWKENKLRFNIGYNHLIYYNIPEGILIRSKARRNLFLFSNSFFFLKKIGTEIKNFRKLSVYKLKGIKDKNELYIKKNWKKGIY